MASRINKLSALAASKLVKPSLHSDGGGLWLQVSAYGAKSWMFRYTRVGKRHDMGLGPFHTVDVATARTLARDWRPLLLDGKDPLTVRSMTFDQCAEAYIDAHRGGWENAKHADQRRNTLGTYVSSLIGSLPVAAVDTELIVKVLSPIWTSKTETATRVRGRIESILDWATVSGVRAGDNPARWRGHLDHLLAPPGKVSRVKNHPAVILNSWL